MDLSQDRDPTCWIWIWHELKKMIIFDSRSTSKIRSEVDVSTTQMNGPQNEDAI